MRELMRAFVPSEVEAPRTAPRSVASRATQGAGSARRRHWSLDSARDKGAAAGLGWRPELAASIFANLDRIDLVEVIADDWLDARERDLRALRLLGATIPMILHGTSLGLASVHPVDTRRLDKFARLIDAVRPVAWSEHLAFVRAGGMEIGHLAAPPRTRATIDGLVANVDRARRIVGVAPALENIATLIDPPLSEMSELAFVREAIGACGVPLLLDLHNLHANAVNFRWSASEFLASIDDLPIAYVHLGGGRMVRNRILDDHLHPTPDPVFALLGELASRRDEPLTIVLERDGRYPKFEELLAELDRARECGGRAAAASRKGGHAARPTLRHGLRDSSGGTAAALHEQTLARLYTDESARARFLAAPTFTIDREGLELAAESFARKRRA